MRNSYLVLLILTFVHNFSIGQEKTDSTSGVIKERLIPLAVGANVAYTGSMVWLSHAWYSNQSGTGFHFFNDNDQWMQMDKMGHAYSAFHISQFAVKSLKWSGVDKKKSIWIGGLAGLVYLTPIEIFDGFSKDYGASWGDMLANAGGSALLLGQYLLWDEPRIQMKFSFHRTPFAQIRPNTLGGTIAEQILKDYNGQTYWLAFNIHSFLPKGNSVPAWLNLSLGYSAYNMQYGSRQENIQAGIHPYRQYFLSFDIDLEHVQTKKKWIKVLTYPFKVIHIPFPALEFNRYGTRFHSVYF
ncbi:MAG: DUF2279 domain-containing protein [Cytophagaceae bacterium]